MAGNTSSECVDVIPKREGKPESKVENQTAVTEDKKAKVRVRWQSEQAECPGKRSSPGQT